MAKKLPTAFIVPKVHIPNGDVSRIVKILEDPKTIRGYEAMLKKIGAKGSAEAGAKLRKATWGNKSGSDICEELAD